MRASILGARLRWSRGRGEARVRRPAAVRSARGPVDQHQGPGHGRGGGVEHGYMHDRAAPDRRLFTDMVTVTGTENLMMAAALADGETVIENAREPEVARSRQLPGGDGRADLGRRQRRDPHPKACERLHGATHAARSHRDRHLPAITGGGPGSGDRHLGPATRRGDRQAHATPAARVESERDDPPDCAGTAQCREPAHRALSGVPTDMQAQFMALNARQGRGRG